MTVEYNGHAYEKCVMNESDWGTANTPAIDVNSVFERRFRILKKLGDGGMSTVYEVEDIGVRRIVALKLMQADCLINDKSRLRFQREAQAAGALNHPHIAKILEFGVAGSGEPYLVMECCHGLSLSQELKTKGSLSEKVSREILRQSMSALAHAHANRVIHRDLKPGNIMLCDSEDGQVNVKIIDFGIAKFNLADSPELTKTGEIFGSPLYMSPEQIDGDKVTDRSDQYSLGCLFYECLTGAPPHVGKTSIETFVKQKTNQVLSLKEASMGRVFSENTQFLVNRLLEKEPAKRFDSMTDALGSFEASTPNVVSMTTPVASKNTSNIKTFLLVGALLFVFGGGIVFAILHLSALRETIVAVPPVVVNAASSNAPVSSELTKDANRSDLDDLDCLNEESHLQQTSFSFSRRQITNSALKGFLEHHQAQRLVLSDDEDITDDGMVYIKHLPWLHLDLSRTRITDKALTILNLTSLQSLRLEKTAITDVGLTALVKATNLETLGLKRTAITSAGLVKLAKLPKLKELDLNVTKIGTAGLEAIRASHISKLYLDETPIKDSDLMIVAKLPLKVLSIKKTEISDKGLLYLIVCKSLEHLTLSRCPNVTDAGIEALHKAMPKLVIENRTEF